jgi:hypothetical protein
MREGNRGWAVLLLRVAGGAMLLLASVVLVILGQGGDPRKLLRREPPRVNYAWLRQGLDAAAEAANNSAVITGRGSTIAAARGLERAILYSRSSARRTGTQPVPAGFREAFADYFPSEVLSETRWALSNRNIDLGTAIEAWYGRAGGAVTLRDTIVFSTRNAASIPLLWAHELTHVLQYQELGVEQFTRIYVSNPELLERQARENAARIIVDLRRRRAAERAAESLPPAP